MARLGSRDYSIYHFAEHINDHVTAPPADTFGVGEAHSPRTRSGEAAGRQRGRRYVPRGRRQTAVRSRPERATLVTRRVELDSSEVSDCAYVAVVEAAAKWRICSGNLTVSFSSSAFARG